MTGDDLRLGDTLRRGRERFASGFDFLVCEGIESCFVAAFCVRGGLFGVATVLVFGFFVVWEEGFLLVGAVVFALRSFRFGPDFASEGSGGPFDLLLLDTELPSLAGTRPFVDEEDDDPTRVKPLRSGTIGCGDVILTEPKFEMRS